MLQAPENLDMIIFPPRCLFDSCRGERQNNSSDKNSPAALWRTYSHCCVVPMSIRVATERAKYEKELIAVKKLATSN